MRNLLMLSAAASVIAIGVSAYHAAALSPGANSASPDGTVLKVQKSDEKGLVAMAVQRVAILALAARTAARVQVLAQCRKNEAQRRIKAIVADRCARVTKARAVMGRRGSNAAMSTSTSAGGAATETGRTDAPGWILMSNAGADPADGMSMLAWGGMGIAAV